MDENWTPCDTYPARLDFTCPNTNCLAHVKLRDRTRPHVVHCKCGLEYGIGADSEMRGGEGRSLMGLLGAYDGIILAAAGFILGTVVGIVLAMRWLK